jgi:glycosyltransferase involved in cell wall biosynthesis
MCGVTTWIAEAYDAIDADIILLGNRRSAEEKLLPIIKERNPIFADELCWKDANSYSAAVITDNMLDSRMDGSWEETFAAFRSAGKHISIVVHGADDFMVWHSDDVDVSKVVVPKYVDTLIGQRERSLIRASKINDNKPYAVVGMPYNIKRSLDKASSIYDKDGVIMFGRLSKRKRFDFVAEAFSKSGINATMMIGTNKIDTTFGMYGQYFRDINDIVSKSDNIKLMIEDVIPRERIFQELEHKRFMINMMDVIDRIGGVEYVGLEAMNSLVIPVVHYSLAVEYSRWGFFNYSFCDRDDLAMILRAVNKMDTEQFLGICTRNMEFLARYSNSFVQYFRDFSREEEN